MRKREWLLFWLGSALILGGAVVLGWRWWRLHEATEAQRTEVGIAVSGDSDIAAAGRKRRVRNMPGAQSQNPRVIAFEDGYR